MPLNISKKTSIAILIWGILLPALFGQKKAAVPTPLSYSKPDTQQLPRFELATIKPTKQDNYKPHGLYVYPGGRIRAKQSTLKMLVGFAFDLKDFQISGGPHWTDEDLYDLEALPPDSAASRESEPKFVNTPPSDEQRKMLQSLLIDRFGLTFHREFRPGAVYLLVRGDKPLRLEEAKHKEYFPMLSIGGHGYGGMSGRTVSMSYTATRLSTYLEHPVLDQTGLVGTFDFKLDPSSTDSSQQSNGDFLSAIFESMKQLGLGLKPAKAPIETLIIDSVTKPTEN